MGSFKQAGAHRHTNPKSYSCPQTRSCTSIQKAVTMRVVIRLLEVVMVVGGRGFTQTVILQGES